MRGVIVRHITGLCWGRRHKLVVLAGGGVANRLAKDKDWRRLFGEADYPR